MNAAATPVRRFTAGVAAVAFGVALSAAGCSSGPSDTEVATEAVANDLLADPVFADYEITPDAAACAGAEVVRSLGAERVLELGELDESSVDLSTLGELEIDAIGLALEVCVPQVGAIVTDIIARSIVAESTPELPVTDAEAACVAERVTEVTELARLIILGLESDADPAALTNDEASAYGRAFADCVDVRPLVLAQVTGAGTDEATVACLDENITDEVLRQAFVDLYTEVDNADPFADAIAACT